MASSLDDGLSMWTATVAYLSRALAPLPMKVAFVDQFRSIDAAVSTFLTSLRHYNSHPIASLGNHCGQKSLSPPP